MDTEPDEFRANVTLTVSKALGKSLPHYWIIVVEQPDKMRKLSLNVHFPWCTTWGNRKFFRFGIALRRRGMVRDAGFEPATSSVSS